MRLWHGADRLLRDGQYCIAQNLVVHNFCEIYKLIFVITRSSAIFR